MNLNHRVQLAVKFAPSYSKSKPGRSRLRMRMRWWQQQQQAKGAEENLTQPLLAPEETDRLGAAPLYLMRADARRADWRVSFKRGGPNPPSRTCDTAEPSRQRARAWPFWSVSGPRCSRRTRGCCKDTEPGDRNGTDNPTSDPTWAVMTSSWLYWIPSRKEEHETGAPRPRSGWTGGRLRSPAAAPSNAFRPVSAHLVDTAIRLQLRPRRCRHIVWRVPNSEHPDRGRAPQDV